MQALKSRLRRERRRGVHLQQEEAPRRVQQKVEAEDLEAHGPAGPEVREVPAVPRCVCFFTFAGDGRPKHAPVCYAILVPAHLYFSRCASERDRSERERSERCASSRVQLVASRFFSEFCLVSFVGF